MIAYIRSAWPRYLFAVLVSLILHWSDPAAGAAECTRAERQCVDSAAKTINGYTYYPSDFGLSCWEYEDTYTCIKPNTVNYCAAFEAAVPECTQISSECSEWDTLLGNGCNKYTQTWQCNDGDFSQPPNTIVLDDTYTLVSSDWDTTPAQEFIDGACQIAAETCTSTSPSEPLPPGIDPAEVAPDGCYEKKQTWACVTGELINDCAKLEEDSSCTLKSGPSTDPEMVIDGVDTATTYVYTCETAPGSSYEIRDCSGRVECLDPDNCFDTSSEPDQDMAEFAARLETAREVAKYMDPDDLTIFDGAGAKCKSWPKNCCTGSKDLPMKSNRDLINGPAVDVAWYLGTEAFDAASSYVYDMMYSSFGPYIEAGKQALAEAAGNIAAAGSDAVSSITSSVAAGTPSAASAAASAGSEATSAAASAVTDGAASTAAPSVAASFYGVSFWSGGAEAVNMFGQTVSSFGSFGGIQIGFDPYTLAFQLAVMVIMELSSCDADDIQDGAKVAQGLCHKTGSYKKRKLGVVYERGNEYCCYNSKLARIVNEQGRAQIGKGWGSCEGFTIDEFEQLDFSRMDLSEFFNDIIPRDLEAVKGQIDTYVESRTQDHYNNM